MLRRQISLGGVQLEDKQTKSPLFTRQMSQIADQGYKAAQDGDESDHTEVGPEPDDAHLVSHLFITFLNNLTVFV